ncbi:MAG: hypothetical protein LBI86_06540 [Treponema sp.]|jgi:hypothetical protein|nr:hypothetical protein [Treponema sp.]
MAKEPKFELRENEESIAGFRVRTTGFSREYDFQITNQRIVLVSVVLFGKSKKEPDTINYADIESAKNAFHFYTLTGGYACFALMMKDGTKKVYAVPKTLKDDLRNTASMISESAARDARNKHGGVFGNAAKWEKWDQIRKNSANNAYSKGHRGRRDSIVSLVNQALAIERETPRA